MVLTAVAQVLTVCTVK